MNVSSTVDNALFAVHSAVNCKTDAGIGDMVTNDAKHLHGPLGLAPAPNGDLISTQSDAINPDPNQLSEVVEFTTAVLDIWDDRADPCRRL